MCATGFSVVGAGSALEQVFYLVVIWFFLLAGGPQYALSVGFGFFPFLCLARSFRDMLTPDALHGIHKEVVRMHADVHALVTWEVVTPPSPRPRRCTPPTTSVSGRRFDAWNPWQWRVLRRAHTPRSR